MKIRFETPQDYSAIQQIHTAAFPTPMEAHLVNRLRETGDVVLSLVAEVEGTVCGHILFSRLQVVTPHGELKAASLAPVAVLPEFQHQGIGSALIREGLKLLTDQGWQTVIVLGEPAYYQRFGFTRKLAESLRSPYDCEALMARELQPGVSEQLVGTVTYPQPFQELE